MRLLLFLLRQEHPVTKQPDSPIITPNRIFYWAYGSNLSENQMARRCPDAIKYGPMSVKDCALVFRHVADVTLREGSTTPGGLWQITARCERALDVAEGVAARIYMKRYFLIKIAGKQFTCLFYQMRAKDGIMPPSEGYLRKLTKGYADFGLDHASLDLALQESWGGKVLTEDLLERHERNGHAPLARALPPVDCDDRDEYGRPAPMWTEERHG